MSVVRRCGPRRTTPGLSLHPLNQDNRSRRVWIGQVQHAAITRLAMGEHPGERPSRENINQVVHPFFAGLPTPNVRGAKVEAMGGVGAWARYQWPPDSWTLVGVEAEESPGGRPDLWWSSGVAVVADEIKTATRTRRRWNAQLASQLARGAQQWGGAFVGVRLFVTGDWSQSLWLPVGGTPIPLAHTRYWFPA